MVEHPCKNSWQMPAYGMPWKTLMKMMIAKYCPQNKIKKLEIEIWDLKVKGTDLASYTQHFQELALMCGRVFLEESDVVEKYVGGLPDMNQGNVMSYQTQDRMEEAVEMGNYLEGSKTFIRWREREE
ncbi:reverse transcriptase domain-containing protein [Tanacetum coccineum]|uniref:Reverse transcriptase domain-containing protein n=1 Tax=Tanacetum coccineum TaxID=301880 RepID=A0ABQ5FY09_9ASTR